MSDVRFEPGEEAIYYGPAGMNLRVIVASQAIRIRELEEEVRRLHSR